VNLERGRFVKPTAKLICIKWCPSGIIIYVSNEQTKGGHHMSMIAKTELRAVPFACAAGNSPGGRRIRGLITVAA
jgi:hypothetical protein